LKKKLNIVLLILVMCLWGTVIYKYVNQYFIKNEPFNFKTKSNYTFKNEILKKDTFNLEKIDRDPFLGNMTTLFKDINTTSHKKNSRKQLNIEPQKVAKKIFPNIIYYGYIKATDKSQETILLFIDGKFSRLNLNEDKDGLKIISLKKDSIRVFFNKELRWFKKK
jgi:hypothetical protein